MDAIGIGRPARAVIGIVLQQSTLFGSEIIDYGGGQATDWPAAEKCANGAVSETHHNRQ